MARIVEVQYVGPIDEVRLPTLGITVKRGGTVKVSAEVAGMAPGAWHVAGDADPLDWPRRLGEDGVTVETYDPGSGLLAQTDNFKAWARVMHDGVPSDAKLIHMLPPPRAGSRTGCRSPSSGGGPRRSSS